MSFTGTSLTPAYYGNKGTMLIKPVFANSVYLYNSGYISITMSDLSFGDDVFCKVLTTTMEINYNFDTCVVSGSNIKATSIGAITTSFYI
jgi:hypothetical protein